LVSILNRLARGLLTPSLRSFEVLCNRFATAKFDLEALLEDFKQVFDGVRESIQTPPSVQRYLVEQLTALLDAKMLNKVIANPARLVFTNAVAWNTFISAFCSLEAIDFKLLKQSVYVLMMVKKLTDPQTIDGMVASICADLDPKLIFYFLKNFRTDEMMPDPVNPRVFGDRYHLPDITSVQAVTPKPVLDYHTAGRRFDLAAWNRVSLTSAVSRLYPFFTSYVQ
jgi:hypothetical protein